MTIGISIAMSRLAVRQGGPAQDPDAFRMTVRTTGASENFTIPCQDFGTFDAVIDWGDGTTSEITAYNDADLAHTYATAGDYQISITGTFPNIRFNNTGTSKDKVISVDNLGATGLITLEESFSGCTQMVSFTAGQCDTSLLTNMRMAFFEVDADIDLSGMNTSNVTSMMWMIRNAICTGFNVTGLDFEGVTNFFNMNAGGTIPTADYDALLIALAAQNVADSQTIGIGATYTPGGAAEAARTSLVNDDLWTITDGGPA